LKISKRVEGALSEPADCVINQNRSRSGIPSKIDVKSHVVWIFIWDTKFKKIRKGIAS
jgi:hypothetical protein